MKLEVDTSTVASAVFSIITVTIFSSFSKVFSETIIFYLGIPFALTIFLFSLIVLRRDNKGWAFKITMHNPQTFIGALITLSVLAVTLIPPYTGSALGWMSIPSMNWLRYVASLLLTTFFPGYFLVKILDRKRDITGSIIIVLSYLLSLFTMFVIGFFILLSGNSMSLFGSTAVVAINLAMIVIYHFTHGKNARGHSLTVNGHRMILISSILMAIMVGALITMISNLPLTPGDMQRHHGLALQYFNCFPIHGGKLMPPYPYLFHIYLAVLFSLAGIPSVLVEQGLFTLSFMPLLAFYCAIKTWFNKREDQKILSIAILLSILLGFGGLYAIYSRFANPAYDVLQLLANTTLKTYDIGMRCLYLPDIVAPVWNIGLPTFFALLYLLKKRVAKIAKATLIPVLVALGYLGHISETFFFILILLIYVLFSKPDNEKNIGLYIILGLIITAFIDLAAPAQIYVFSSSGTGNVISLPYVASLLLAILAYIMELLKDRRVLHLTTELRKSLLKVLDASWGYGKWVMLYTYSFFVIVWLTLQNDFNLWEWGGYYFTPFFVFPLRLGPVGLLAIISIFVYFPKIIRDKRLLFFLLLIPTGFVMEQASSYYPLYYPAYRYATLTFIGACITAAYGITMLLKKTLNSPSIIRRISTYTLISVLIISGFLSTTLYYVNATYYSKHWDISQEEEDALCYIRQYTSTNSSVLTFTKESANRLRNFAGLNPVQDAQRWSKLLLSTSNPYIITHVLGSSNVKYIYVAQRDAELLNSNNVLSSFVDYFPKVFKSDYVTVYEVPLLTPPSPEASVAVLNLSPSLQKSEDTTWIDDSFTEGWYPYRQYGEIKSYELEVRDGIAEISVTSNQSGNVWISYSLPLALKTDDSTISFRYRVDNDHTWFTIQLRNTSNHVFFHEGRLTQKVFTTKHYPLPDGQVVSRAEIIIETTNEAPSGTVAMAEIDCIEISSSLFSKPDVFPSLFISLLHSKYSLFYVDNALMEKLGSYISNYTNLMLPSDPPNPIEPLINWVTEGNTLTVFNTHGNGFFAKLLELNDSSSIFLTKELGAGEILYINCFPSIKAGNQSTLIQPNLIEEVKENSAMNEYIHRVNVLPVYNSTLNAIEVKGNLTIYTDVLMLEGSIHLTDSPFSSNNFSEIKMYGRVNLTIGNANLLIFPLESYMLIKPVSHFVEGKVLVSGPETSIVADTNITYSRNVPVSVRFNASNLSLYARLPSICAEGTITIDELDVHSALYIPLAGIVQQKAEIQGKVNFSTMYISGPLMLFSKFQAKGRILELGEMTSRPTIPWAQVFMSPYNLIFNTFFILGTALYAFQKRKRSHKNQHLSDGESTNKHLE